MGYARGFTPRAAHICGFGGPHSGRGGEGKAYLPPPLYGDPAAKLPRPPTLPPPRLSRIGSGVVDHGRCRVVAKVGDCARRGRPAPQGPLEAPWPCAAPPPAGGGVLKMCTLGGASWACPAALACGPLSHANV